MSKIKIIYNNLTLIGEDIKTIVEELKELNSSIVNHLEIQRTSVVELKELLEERNISLMGGLEDVGIVLGVKKNQDPMLK